MEAQQHSLEISQKVRYFTLGELNPDTPSIWFVCHGYGQLAPYFIRHFKVLADAGHFVVAPEGLSRFYLKGFSGRVGASWMTKEDRGTDIQNYVSYLSAVKEAALKGYSAPLKLLGFSQGVATICRWALLSGQAFDQLVLWAGVFPADLPPEYPAAFLKNKKVSVVYGNQDPFIKQEDLKEQLEILKKLNARVEEISFTGSHEINQQVLKNNFATS